MTAAKRKQAAARILAAALALATVGADSGVTLASLPGGRHLAFRCSGHGRPTVVLESGWAATSRAWSRVQAPIAATTRVCSYDRAGMGLSDPGPTPRDGAAIVGDLNAGLRAARIGGPYVLVGHSAGGLYVRLFASRYPRDVVGIVLVDPSVVHQDARLAAAFGPGAGSTEGLRARTAACLAAASDHHLPSPDPALARCDARAAPATLAAELSELDALWGATSDEIDAAPPTYGAMPLIVLTAGDKNAGLPPPAQRIADRVWAGLHDEISEKSTGGVRRTIAGSSHLMPRDRPDAIVAAVLEIVAAVRVSPATAPRATPAGRP